MSNEIMRVYITRQGDMADGIAWAVYGHERGTTEALLQANPHIVALPPRLPANIRIVLPALAPQPVRKIATVNLWD